MTALVELDGISKSFGGGGWFARAKPVQALRGVDLRIARGEALGVVGESGSGKSTLGRVALGLLEPGEGSVRFDGSDVAGASPAQWRALRRRMQIVFQDPYGSLDPRRRVGAQIADGLAIHDIVPAHARAAKVAELLALVGLPAEHANRFPHEFSGGQRQRVGIARALATGPDFLMADEPVSALDVSIQAQIVGLLAKLRAELGLALMFVSHDLRVVRRLCDRVQVLYLGRTMEEGPTARVFDAPAHPYTRALLAAAPRLDGTRRKKLLLPGDPPSPTDPPSGCVFRTRCAHATAECAVAIPPLRELAPGHKAACIHAERIPPS
jgi:oligopeptide/dipeptide ABC transporter ATP-binding protein